MPEDVQRSFLGFMPRSLRLEFSGAFYHVMARGKHREAINDDDDDRHCGHEMARDASALAQLGQRQLRKFTGPASDRPYCPKPCNDGSLGQEMPPDPRLTRMARQRSSVLSLHGRFEASDARSAPIGLAVPRLAIKVPRLKPKVPRRNLEVPRRRAEVPRQRPKVP